MGNSCCTRRKEKKRIVLLLVGLDNAGKSVAVKGLAGEPLDSIIPTVGLSVVYLQYRDYSVKIFDLGGGPNIRDIWKRYFVDAHGIIFVVDSSDYCRLNEARQVLGSLLSHEKISGKPVLLLANKQDVQEALDEVEIVEKLDLESLVNTKKCPTLVETCSAVEATPRKLDAGIQRGYQWLLNFIIRNYEPLNVRVQKDVALQEQEEQRIRLEKIERLKKLNEAAKRDDDLIESFSDYDRKINGELASLPRTSFEDPKEILYIHTTHHNDAMSYSSSGSVKSSKSIPVYYGNLEDSQRPRSATQFVKNQLELGSEQRRSFRFLAHKTAPVRLYGVQHPRSARERRQRFVDDRRILKSAGDSTFVTHLPNAVAQPEEPLHANHFLAKLPPLKLANGVADKCDIGLTDV